MSSGAQRIASLAALAACALGATAAQPQASAAATARLSGQVETAGGPVADATVRVYAAGARSARRVGSGTTADDGTYTVRYTHPGKGAPLYVVAERGRVDGTALDPRVRLAAVAGLTGALASQVHVDERSTVATAYAFARFLDGRTISGPSPGMPNATASAANLFDVFGGKVSFTLGNSPNGAATEALPTFNTLANALAACTTGGARGCDRLLAAARPDGGARPRDTLAAAVAAARNPSQNQRALFDVAIGRRAGYRPALSKAPNAWLLALLFTGNGLNAPGLSAIDRHGNQWIGNNFAVPGTTASEVLTALDPAGQALFPRTLVGGGIRGPGWGTAVDQRGRVWTANFAGDSVSVFGPDGRPLSPPGGYTRGGYSRPQGIAIDRRGTVWVANFGNDSVTRIPGGNPRRAHNIRGGGIEKPFGIAIDADGHAWVTNGAESSRPGSVTELLPDGRPSARSPITGGGLLSPQGIAVDSADNKWIANLGSRSVTRLLPDGRVSSDSPLGRPGVKGGWGVAVDGADHVWVAGFLGANVSELCGVRAATCPPGARDAGAQISPRGTGYASAVFEHITGVTIDQSGNVWLANNWTTGSSLREFVGGNGMVQLVGAATPVRGPLIGPPRQP